MIFAHTPIAFLIPYYSRKKWSQNLSSKQIKIVFIIAIIGGLFPDIDLLYYYLFAADFSHHEAFTHSAFIYLILFCVLYLLFYLLKNNFYKKIITFFFLGVLSHLLADSVGAGVIWLYPFSKEMYGLTSFDWFRDSFFGQNFFVTNYSFEVLFFILVIIAAVNNFIHNQQKKIIAKIIFIALFIFFITSIFFINQHLFHSNSRIYFEDNDQDGIVNKEDLDLDGDNILNLSDPDIDNNGEDNSMAMYIQTLNLPGTWYDLSENGLVEIPLRIGFVSNNDIIRRVYDNIGIFMRAEMEQDYNNNQNDYLKNPKNKDFDRIPANWLAFLKHQDKLFSPEQAIQEYDILFFNDNYVALALWEENNKRLVLAADRDEKKVIKTSLSNIVSKKGEIQYIGRLIPKPKNKQY